MEAMAMNDEHTSAMFRIRNFGNDRFCRDLPALIEAIQCYRGKSVSVVDLRPCGQILYVDVSDTGELRESYGARARIDLRAIFGEAIADRGSQVQPVNRDDMRLEGVALGVLEQSGIESMTENESVKVLGLLAIHVVARLQSIRGADWTSGFLDTIKAKMQDSGPESGPRPMQ